MLQVVKENRENIAVFKLRGTVDEFTNFVDLMGAIVDDEVEVHCREITRFNSEGLRRWMRYFEKLAASGKKLHFLECSTVTIEQANRVSNFAPKGTIESFYVPYFCKTCDTEFLGLAHSWEVGTGQLVVPPQVCIKCGAVANFDDDPVAYFGFLKR